MPLPALLALAALWEVRTVQSSDLRAPFAAKADGFPQLVKSIEQATAERVTSRKNEHLVYFVLQSASVAAMLAPEGYFMHNEPTPEVEACGREAGLDVVQARTLRLGRFTDSFVIQRKVR